MTRSRGSITGLAAGSLLVPVLAGCTALAAGANPPPSPRPARHSATSKPRPRIPARVVVRHLRLPDGHLMTVARFTGPVRFVLHCGSVDPGPPCRADGLSAGRAVRWPARRLLIAAFNGGFKLSTGAGGYEQQGQVIRPLARGRASLVIYRSGAVGIGAWGHGVPAAGRGAVDSVRQNLDLLVSDGHATRASRGAWGYWGGTITGGEVVARSALGQNARGQLIYVASMSATPGDLARALVRAGALVGMELDINPEWVQLAYAKKPGGRLRRGVAGQVRPANQYLKGWTRDFIAVMATWAPASATPGPSSASRG